MKVHVQVGLTLTFRVPRTALCRLGVLLLFVLPSSTEASSARFSLTSSSLGEGRIACRAVSSSVRDPPRRYPLLANSTPHGRALDMPAKTPFGDVLSHPTVHPTIKPGTIIHELQFVLKGVPLLYRHGTMSIDQKDAFLKKLGSRIRSLRLQKGLRQEDFDDGTDLGITSRGFQGIEYGQKNVKAYTLAIIAERLGVTLAELFDFESGKGKGRKAARSSDNK